MNQQNKRLAYAREILSGAEQRMGLLSSGVIRELEKGELRGGEVYCSQGSIGQMIRALCSVLSEGQWCVAIALPQLGWGAAVELGVPVERTIAIPDVQGKAEQVLHYLIPYMDVLCVGAVPLSRAQQQKVAARVRHYRTVLLTVDPWPGISKSLPQAVDASAAFSGEERGQFSAELLRGEHAAFRRGLGGYSERKMA